MIDYHNILFEKPLIDDHNIFNSKAFKSPKLPRAKLGKIRCAWACLGMPTKRVAASVYYACGITSSYQILS